MPKLLVLTSTFPRWENDAIPSFVFDLCLHLSKYFEIWVIAPHAPRSANYELMSGIHVVRFRYLPESMERLAYGSGIMANLRGNPLNLYAIPFYLFSLYRKTRELLSQHDFTALHAHWVIPQGLVASLFRTQVSRIVCTAHGSDLNTLNNPIWRRIQSWILGKVDTVTVVSEDLARRVLALGIPQNRITQISMGIDTQRFFIPSEDPCKKSILFIGRLAPEKGLDILLRAFQMVLNDHPSAQLVIIGDGQLRSSLESICKQLCISSHTLFVGSRPHSEIPFYISKSSLVVMPSINEGFGLVAAEACACKRAVVASDLPSLREIVDAPNGGVLFPVGNIQELAKSITMLLGDDVLRANIALTGYHAVTAKFGWDLIAARYARTLNPEHLL